MARLEIAPDDDLLSAFEGLKIASTTQGVSYAMDRALGAGSFAVAFLALRRAPEGEQPVVMKFVRPRMIRAAGETALLAVEKETVALSRLNDRVPETPFVVRLIDHGVIRVTQSDHDFDLPWLALEYVHGGAEGTTLDERVDFSMEQTGSAFDPERAALAISCLSSGLDAVHEVGVVHRDLTPWNVLCCGYGEREIFKIADFGIARPIGLKGTFGGFPGGTPGYAPPEQILYDNERVGPASDVFSLAAVVFRVLTGEDYFPAESVGGGVTAVIEQKRRSIRDCRGLCDELRARPAACDLIDSTLERATSADPRHRPPRAWDLAAPILRVLKQPHPHLRPPRRRLDTITERSRPARFGWSWHVRHGPRSGQLLRSVAWDGDGHCLCATHEGLAFWAGTGWRDVPPIGLPNPEGIRFVRRVGAGVWLVGGDQATIAKYSRDGVSDVLHGADTDVAFSAASGELDDLAVVVGTRAGESPLLFAMAAGRWLKPAQLSRAESISSLARLDDERWLLVGRTKEGGGYAAIYAPLMFEVKRLKVPDSESYLSCACQPDPGVGAVVGTKGRALCIKQDEITEFVVPGTPDLTAVAVDVGGRIWAASTGAIWLFQPEANTWTCEWRERRWNTPFVSLYSDAGRVIAMTIDGAVVEGHWQPQES